MLSTVTEDTHLDNIGTGTMAEIDILMTNDKTKDVTTVTIATETAIRNPSLKIRERTNMTASLTTKHPVKSTAKKK